MLKWQNDGNLELMRTASAAPTTAEEEEKSLWTIQSGHYFVTWDGIRPREISVRHSQGWEGSSCEVCLGKGGEPLRQAGRMHWGKIYRTAQKDAVHTAETVQALKRSSEVSLVGTEGSWCCLSEQPLVKPGCSDWAHTSPAAFAISNAGGSRNTAWRTRTSSESARNDGKSFPRVWSDYL